MQNSSINPPRHAADIAIHIDADRLREFATATLTTLGFPKEQVTDVTDAMVWADERGLRGHGVVHRLAQCVRRVASGGTDPAAVPSVRRESDSIVQLDGNNAWGQAAAVFATRHALRKAQNTGLGLATVHNISSAAALGYYAYFAASRDMIGMAVTNCPPLIAAPGGKQRVLGNQAHSFGFPATSHPPVIFDSSLTLMSTTEMDRRIAMGEELPEGVLLDRDGEPTTNPSDWFEGTLVPMGGYRGFGLALAFEFLTSALAGSDRPSFDVSHPYEHDRPQGVSFTYIAIDPTKFGSASEFGSRMEHIINVVHASGFPDQEPPRIPGERQSQIATNRAHSGVPLTHVDVEGLREVAELVGLPSPIRQE